MKHLGIHWLRGLVLGACLLLPTHADACAVCFGSKGDRMTEVASWAILSLLAVLLFVLSIIGYFIYTLVRRSRLAS